jgi:hypothetical protein
MRRIFPICSQARVPTGGNRRRRAALDLLKEQPFDFVISDINMPRISGYDLLRQVRADSAIKSLPVLPGYRGGQQGRRHTGDPPRRRHDKPLPSRRSRKVS